MRSILNVHGLAALAACLAAAPAWGQAYPAKPVRLLVTSTAGGSVDTVARTIGAKLGEKLGQQVIVDNRPGAGGTIAANVLAKAPADGYTLILGTAPLLALNPSEEFLPSAEVLAKYAGSVGFQP